MRKILQGACIITLLSGYAIPSDFWDFIMRSGTMASLSNYKKLFSLQLDENPISKTLTE